MAVGTGMRRTAGKRVLAGLAAVGVVVIAGLLAAWGVGPGESHAASRGMSSRISPNDVVALRFPADWKEDETADTGAPAAYTLASLSDQRSDEGAMLFSPNPMWPLAAMSAAAPAPSAAAASAPRAEARLEAKSEPKSEAKPEAKSDPAAEAKPAPKAKPVVVATRSLAPVHHPAPRAKDAGMPFNDAQLASIKARLKLSDYQQQYWPAVAAALHAIGVRVTREPARAVSAYAGEGVLAGIDPDGPEVQQLKSAAFPLIMSMNEEQKNQVRVLARMMGLEQVASSF